MYLLDTKNLIENTMTHGTHLKASYFFPISTCIIQWRPGLRRSHTFYTSHMRRCPNVGLLLVHRLRRWPNCKPTLANVSSSLDIEAEERGSLLNLLPPDILDAPSHVILQPPDWLLWGWVNRGATEASGGISWVIRPFSNESLRVASGSEITDCGETIPESDQGSKVAPCRWPEHLTHPSKHKTLTQWCFNSGSPS